MLERRRLGRIFSVLLVVLFVSCLLTGIGWAVGSQIRQLVNEFPKHRDNIEHKINSLEGTSIGFVTRYVPLPRDWIKQTEPANPEAAEPNPEAAPEPARPAAFDWFPKILGPVLEFLAKAALVVVLVIFMLVTREDLRNRVIRVAGVGRLTSTTRAFDDAAGRISRYLIT